MYASDKQLVAVVEFAWQRLANGEYSGKSFRTQNLSSEMPAVFAESSFPNITLNDRDSSTSFEQSGVVYTVPFAPSQQAL